MNSSNSTKKEEAVVENKAINEEMIKINNTIRSLYSNLTCLENRLYPILDSDDDDKCVEEDAKEPDKLYGKLVNIKTDIGNINGRVCNILRLLMIDRFE